jgi:hypothetical protein
VGSVAGPPQTFNLPGLISFPVSLRNNTPFLHCLVGTDHSLHCTDHWHEFTIGVCVVVLASARPSRPGTEDEKLCVF